MRKLLLIAAIMIAGVGSGILAYLYFHDSASSTASGNRLVEKTRNGGTTQDDFGFYLQLNGNPIGIANNGDEMVLCNREDPWGFLRLRKQGEGEYEIEKIAVTESQYNQKLGFYAVTWNGTEYVTYCDGAFFQRNNTMLFLHHDPSSLAVTKQTEAPESLGCLAWDGKHYWAATRKNTPDEQKEAFLYELNADLQVIQTYDPPAVGCQGLTWDGRNLWFADVFDDSIYILDISDDMPAVVHEFPSPFHYLSGVGFDGESIWIAEYDNNRLHRLNPSRIAEWTGVTPLPESGSVPSGPGAPAFSESEKKSFAEYIDSFPDTASNDMDVLELKAEIRDETLLCSWKLHFGDELFTPSSPPGEDNTFRMPTFVRYTLTVEGETIEKKELQYEAEPGTNEHFEEVILEQIAPGSYSVSMFLHAQFVDAEGTNRILNQNSPSIEVSW